MANDNNEEEFWGTEPVTRRLPAIGRRRTPTSSTPTVGRREHTGPLPTVSVRRPAEPTPARSAATDWDDWDDWDDDPWGATTGSGTGAYGSTRPRQSSAAGTAGRSQRSDRTGPIEVPLTAMRRTQAQTIDPLLKKIGAAVAAIALLIPIGSSLFGDDSPSGNLGAQPAANGEVGAPVADPQASSSTLSDDAADQANDEAIDEASDDAADDAGDTDSAVLAPAAESKRSSSSRSAGTRSKRTTTTTDDSGGSTGRLANATAATCSTKIYRVRSGDFWLSIARAKRVTLKALLASNKATSKTMLHPGQLICVPKPVTPGTRPTTSTSTPTASTRPTSNTTKPKPTTTTTTEKPTSSTTKPKPTTTTTTKPKPTTTTTAVPPKKTYTKAEVMQIIREVWPDDQEDKALAIAWRESNYVPTVRNYCCIGLFQIYWNVHKSWLLPLGVTEKGLYDPRINAMAALALYNRAGGWGPWAL